MRITPYYESKGVKNPYYVLSPTVVNGAVRELKKQGEEYLKIIREKYKFKDDEIFQIVNPLLEIGNPKLIQLKGILTKNLEVSNEVIHFHPCSKRT